MQLTQGMLLLFSAVVKAESTESTTHTVDSSTLITTAVVPSASTETCKSL